MEDEKMKWYCPWETDLFSVLEHNAIEFDWFIKRRAVSRETNVSNRRTLLT